MDPIECSEQMLEDLSTSLDAVGLPPINPKVDVLHQLVSATRGALQLHRNSLQEIRDLCIKISVMKEDTNIKASCNNDLEEKIKKMSQIIALKDNVIFTVQNEISDLKSHIKHLEIELVRINEFNKSPKNKPTVKTSNDPKLKKLLEEAEKARQIQLVNEITGRTCKDEEDADSIQKLEAKECVYKSTIKSLQDNNTALTKELLEMKDKVANRVAGVGKKNKRR